MKEKDLKSYEIIKKETCKVFGLPESQLMQHRREMRFIDTRSAIYYFLRDKTLLSYPDIGEIFKRDHATIINGVERAYKRMKKDYKYADKISILEKELNKPEYEQIFTRDE